MYPSSPNIKIKLLTLISDNDEIGNSILKLVKEKEVIGISKSITSKEYYESKKQEYIVDVALKILIFYMMDLSMLNMIIQFIKLKELIYLVNTLNYI